MRPADNTENLIKKLRYKAGAEAHDRILDNVMQALDESEKQKVGATAPDIWRTIMKSPITKIAAAVVVIAGVLIVMHFVGLSTATVTFADVIKPILNAQTAELDIIIGEEGEGPVIHDMVMGSRIRRTLSNVEGVVAIIDLQEGRILQLTHEKKEAAYIDLKDWSSIPNYMERLRNVIDGLQAHPEFKVEELGEQEISGQKLIGFRAMHPKAEITIWADPETALPVRIESTGGQIFSMEVPPEYKQQETELDLHGATEGDFIEGLRIMAEVFGDGQFPDSVALEDYLKQAPAIVKKCEELGLSEQEQTELGLKLQNYLLFIRFFKGEGQWHYAGNGVKLGDADTAVFWYRPEGSETYRVIYADLRVEDVSPENLPE